LKYIISEDAKITESGQTYKVLLRERVTAARYKWCELKVNEWLQQEMGALICSGWNLHLYCGGL